MTTKQAVKLGQVKRDLERALVAVDDRGHAFVMVAKGLALRLDLEDVGPLDVGEALPPTPDKATGLWVLDVVPYWPRSYDGESDSPEYDSGTWRRPNLDELLKVLEGDLQGLADSWTDVLDQDEAAMQAAEDADPKADQLAGEVLALVEADATTAPGFSPDQEREIAAGLNAFLNDPEGT